MSREHYFSRGVFLAETVNVAGPLPSAMTPGMRHINDLVTKCLCRKHNQELSPLDQALIDLFNSIRECERLMKVRKRIARKWPAYTRLVVDGPRIQRCVYKMILSHAVLQKERLDGWRPPTWLADVAFGKREIPQGSGIAKLARIGDQLGGHEDIGFGFGENLQGVPDCAVLTLRSGWKFFCNWDRPVRTLDHVSYGDVVYTQNNILCPPKRVEYTDGDRKLGISLDFDWSGSWSERRNGNVVKLRSKYAAPSRPGSR